MWSIFCCSSRWFDVLSFVDLVDLVFEFWGSYVCVNDVVVFNFSQSKDQKNLQGPANATIEKRPSLPFHNQTLQDLNPPLSAFKIDTAAIRNPNLARSSVC